MREDDGFGGGGDRYGRRGDDFLSSRRMSSQDLMLRLANNEM